MTYTIIFISSNTWHFKTKMYSDNRLPKFKSLKNIFFCRVRDVNASNKRIQWPIPLELLLKFLLTILRLYEKRDFLSMKNM